MRKPRTFPSASHLAPGVLSCRLKALWRWLLGAEHSPMWKTENAGVAKLQIRTCNPGHK